MFIPESKVCYAMVCRTTRCHRARALRSRQKLSKGQLISKCLFDVIVLTKIVPEYCKDFCPKIFVGSWGLLGAFLGLGKDYHLTESLQEAPKGFQEAPRKFKKLSGQKSSQYFLMFLVETMTLKRHLEINWPSASVVRGKENSHYMVRHCFCKIGKAYWHSSLYIFFRTITNKIP